jgi:hypothetical protein
VDRKDVPDFEPTKPPDYVPPEGARAQDALSGTDPFIMQTDGRAWLFVPAGLADGPLPAHHEPFESTVDNPLYGQQANPTTQTYDRPHNRYNPSGSPVFPYVFTTYRLTEHHTAGGMSRTLPYLSELQPEFFCDRVHKGSKICRRRATGTPGTHAAGRKWSTPHSGIVRTRSIVDGRRGVRGFSARSAAATDRFVPTWRARRTVW